MNMEREIRRVLESAQWTDFDLEKTAGGHYRITLKAGDQAKVAFAPSTPSDWRAIPNMKAQLRRAMRELTGEKDKKPSRKRNRHRSIRPKRPAYAIADELRVTRPAERHTFEIPAPLEAQMKLYRMTAGDFDTQKEVVQRKPKKGSPEHRAMMSEKMKASWARRRGRTTAEPKKKNAWGSDAWRERLNESLAKARTAAHTPEANQKRSEAKKAWWARKKAEQEAEKLVVGHGKRRGQPVKVDEARHQKLIAAAEKAREAKALKRALRAAVTGKPRIRVPAISVRVKAEPAPEPRVGAARSARLARRLNRRLHAAE